VLVGTDEDDGSLVSRDCVRQVPLGIQVVRDAQLQDGQHTVNRSRGAGAAEYDAVVHAAANSLVDNGTGIIAQPRRLHASEAGLRVCVGVRRQHLVADAAAARGRSTQARNAITSAMGGISRCHSSWRLTSLQ